ncbi:MAG: hypothetical protein AAGJ37_05740 [Pseudomonadota bacterium]
MAIISCPSCNKAISDKTKECPHCGMSFENQSAEDIERKANYELYKKRLKLQNQSMLAILLFVIGAYFTFMGDFGNSLTDRILQNGALGLTAIGFVWYGVNRVRLALAKRKK